MKLIVGLGNPGVKYQRTRHNVGFRAIDAIADAYGIAVDRKSAHALWGRGAVERHEVLLAKPILFMNHSGTAVSALLQKHRLSPADLFIIHDDFELELGRIRIKTSGGHGGHNGLRSILEVLGTGDFARLKIGIGKPVGEDPSDYVLGRFSSEDFRKILDRTKDVAGVAPLVLEGRLDLARNRLVVAAAADEKEQ